MTEISKLTNSLYTGFIDKNFNSSQELRPILLINDHKNGKKVLTTIKRELELCKEFWFSVAFVTTSGLAVLMNTLILLEKKNIKGRILASQYLNFTQPEALRRIKKFKNIELKISTEGSFHSKGYLFKQDGIFNFIVGSSNLTQSALCSNKELNLKISAREHSELIEQAKKEFSEEFNLATLVTDEFISDYELRWNEYNALEKNLYRNSNHEKVVVKPNLMQREALANIENIRSKGNTKALLISATGTGKTYLSAFDVQKFKPQKFLFIVHRRTIAEESLKTFKRLLGDNINMGVFSGSTKDLNSDYIFSTVQTISKQENLDLFSKNYFDYIVIDETHRAGAKSYLAILNHFTPKFLLGMTATPERTDGLDVFKLFNYNIAYEIRLHRALEENMLSPFHYFGVSDLTINGEEIDDKTEFNKLCSVERVDRIIENAKFYGCDDGNVRGLVFCSRNDISVELSRLFNEKGYQTIALTGSNTEQERQDAIKRLESDVKGEKIDYIFTVDIFNEGIDIPKINQIIMLRPTQSAIIFVQQLGRGLRKLSGKEYLTVIDFIGNYSNNYLVPIALYGDKSYNKDTLRKLIASESSFIPGDSTINFDEITKEKIYNSINQSNLSKLADLKHDYLNLKNKLGRLPLMIDFVEHGSRDPFQFVNYSKSYFNFLTKVENEVKSIFDKKTIEFLENFSLEINNGKRIEESLILHSILKHGAIQVNKLKKKIYNKYNYNISDETIKSALENLNFKFIRKNSNVVELKNENIVIGDDLKSLVHVDEFHKYLMDSVQYSIKAFDNNFVKENFIGGFIRYNKYSRKDVCRILNWPLDISSTLYGYRTNNKITPCFVTYHKSQDVDESIDYNDHFIDRKTFAWESRSNRRIESEEIQKVISSKRILLFIKKQDGEGSDFYFVGDCKIIQGSIKQEKMKDGKPVVHFSFELDKIVENDMYKYLTEN